VKRTDDKRHHVEQQAARDDAVMSVEDQTPRDYQSNHTAPLLDARHVCRILSTSHQPVGAMESIAAFDAKTRLSELLERAAKGETFEITKHGRPVGKLGPPDSARDPKVVAEAVKRLKTYRGALKRMSREELLTLTHDGHRF
jgi:prevent-host-death family protein